MPATSISAGRTKTMCISRIGPAIFSSRRKPSKNWAEMLSALYVIKYRCHFFFLTVSPQYRQEYDGKELPPNHPLVLRVEAVANRIIAASALQNERFTFHVINDPSVVKCFVTPGNHMFVFAGILSVLADNEELAILLGRQIAHAVARHHEENLNVYQLTHWATSWLVPLPQSIQDWATERVLGITYSKLQKFEADRIGLTLTARACFNPAVVVNVMRKL
ncbi:MAG: M48 family metalloprotease, partial [Usitatibacteraceae bacterium]